MTCNVLNIKPAPAVKKAETGLVSINTTATIFSQIEVSPCAVSFDERDQTETQKTAPSTDFQPLEENEPSESRNMKPS
jgi:hypothetical protein